MTGTELGPLVVRIVYDGPPLSGKTTTVRGLALRLGAPEVISPEESAGRTVYFDWVEYVGGLFEGRQIHCQIVSVPGQLELRHRREYLIDSADALVFVANTRRAEWRASHDMLAGLVARARARKPPVGIVVQANQRDCPDAVPRELVRSELDALCPMVLVESIATESEGVREAFVLAVRLALDRARALGAEGAPAEPSGARELEREARKVNTPEQLLASLHALETSARRPAAGAISVENLAELEWLLPAPSGPPAVSWAPGRERLFVPDPLMPSGHIWPPVDGRSLLHEVARLSLLPIRTSRGDWWASGSGWRFHSSAAALYPPDEARRLLIEWARLHATHAELLSPRRTLVLADAGSGGYRLWQLVQVEPALRERLTVAGLDAAELSFELTSMAQHLLEARDLFSRSALRLRCTLWTVDAVVGARPRFVGLMPGPHDAHFQEPDGAELLSRELGPQLRELERTHPQYAQLRRELRALPDRGVVAETLAELA